MKFLIISLILIMFLLSFFANNKFINNRIYQFIIIFTLLLTLALLFGWKLEFPDTDAYTNIFKAFIGLPFFYTLSESPFEIGFTAYQWFISNFTSNINIYISMVFILFILTVLLGFKKIYGDKLFFALLGFICTPMFPTLAGNILRTGLAFSFFLLGSIYIFRMEKKKGYLFCILSVAFHTTLLPFVLVLLLFNISKIKMKVFLVGWIASAIIFITNIQMKLFPFLSGFEKVELYTSNLSYDIYGNSGIRYDFLLFNTILLIILIIMNKKFFNFKDLKVNFYFKLTIIASIVFHIMGFVAFSDRVAIYVWLFFIITTLIMVIEINKKYAFILPAYLTISIVIIIITKSPLFFY